MTRRERYLLWHTRENAKRLLKIVKANSNTKKILQKFIKECNLQFYHDNYNEKELKKILQELKQH